MENEIKLTEFQFDMLPTDENRLVLENFVLLDDNLDSTEDLVLDNHISKQIFPLKLMFPLILICRQGEIKMQMNLEEIVLGSNDILIMVPGSIGEDVSMSKDCRLAMMAIPESAFPMLMKMDHSLKFRERYHKLFKTFDPADELPADEYRWLRHAELGLRMELDLTQR